MNLLAGYFEAQHAVPAEFKKGHLCGMPDQRMPTRANFLHGTSAQLHPRARSIFRTLISRLALPSTL